MYKLFRGPMINIMIIRDSIFVKSYINKIKFNKF
jgi:hypothetical protein